jgi:hypothetical protein
MFKTYFKREDKFEKTRGDSAVRVLVDILMGFIIFLLSIMISI